MVKLLAEMSEILRVVGEILGQASHNQSTSSLLSERYDEIMDLGTTLLSRAVDYVPEPNDIHHVVHLARKVFPERE